MEEEPFNPIREKEERQGSLVLPEAKPLPKLSFISDELLKKIGGDEPHGARDRCALFGAILGVVAVVSWIVIIFGVVYSVAGIILSVIGLNSSRQKLARIGLGLSFLGLILSLLYIFAAYNGMINYNYFTSEFWSESTIVVEGGIK